MATTVATGSGSVGSPCGACKFLRRKCTSDCVFAPYFSSEQGSARFAAIHKIFGASNVAKLLMHLPQADRYETVVTIAYEAQARVRDPVYGCVAHIFALQQQVAALQAQLMQVKAQLAHNLVDYRISENQWTGNVGSYYHDSYTNQETPHRVALDSMNSSSIGGMLNHESYYREGELQALALRMMRN